MPSKKRTKFASYVYFYFLNVDVQALLRYPHTYIKEISHVIEVSLVLICLRLLRLSVHYTYLNIGVYTMN